MHQEQEDAFEMPTAQPLAAAPTAAEAAAKPIEILRLATKPYRKPEDRGFSPGEFQRHGPALHRAAHTGSLSQVTARLKAGDPVDSRDALGMTPLMIAAAHGEFELAKALLAAGADPLARAGDGRAVSEFAGVAVAVRPRSETAAKLNELLSAASQRAHMVVYQQTRPLSQGLAR